ncbi:class I SAM-dependent methyltransferase [Streptomyces sp. NPDC014894]|uniref:class I SAM-dependent methyltransferase n=1 Tax=Streptomyces sp. NPDC014894 TaxID=3364931 RepID=UPI003700BB07
MQGPSLAVDSPERFEDMVAKAVQECQNGLPDRVLRLATALSWPVLRDRIADYARRTDALCTVRGDGLELRVPRAAVTVERREAAVLVSCRRTAPTPQRFAELPAPDDAVEVWQLAELLTGLLPGAGDVLAREEEALATDALKHASWLVATLACDVLNRAGTPAVPQFVRDHGPGPDSALGGEPGGPGPDRGHGDFTEADGTFTEVWEARISVDEYALFEAVHPAYAVQMVELGRMVRAHCPAPPDRVLDVGSGPGLPTVMLAEMFPDARIDAVEPSRAAFPHLLRNVAGHAITAYNAGITDFTGRRDYPVSVSVGASHHLDTRLFLRGLRRHTAPGGLIVVADEMIAPFASVPERTRGIIDHHFVYIDQALAHVREDDLPPAERRRLRALLDPGRRTPEGLRSLLAETRQNRFLHAGDDSPWQRVRFCVLELEALVAGVDYDVERKTYVENFRALAEDEGLVFLEHRRVHATVGARDLDAGTHVVALRNPGRCL